MSARNAVLLFLMAFMVGPVFLDAQDQTSPPVVLSDMVERRTEMEQRAFYLVNQYRKENDLDPLVWNSGVARIAREHSRDMATGECDFGHDGFNDRIKAMKSFFTSLRGAGENVFMADDPAMIADHAVTTWLESPPHLHNIRGDFNCAGMGVWEGSNGRIYFTQVFAKVPPVAAPASP